MNRVLFRAALWATVVAGATLLAVAPPASSATSPLRLGARLKSSGRAECSFVRIATDPLSGRSVSLRGRLALEAPDRARLDFLDSGERITLRGDGGEWLQPKLRQLVVFTPERAAGGRRWWQLLIDGAAPGIALEPKPGRRLILRSEGGAGPDSATLDLNAAGLPIRLRVPDGEAIDEYRFSRWSFGPARGAKAFRLPTPSGFERVEFP